MERKKGRKKTRGREERIEKRGRIGNISSNEFRN